MVKLATIALSDQFKSLNRRVRANHTFWSLDSQDTKVTCVHACAQHCILRAINFTRSIKIFVTLRLFALHREFLPVNLKIDERRSEIFPRNEDEKQRNMCSGSCCERSNTKKLINNIYAISGPFLLGQRTKDR
jgi:hypothetical protein